jgi:transposase
MSTEVNMSNQIKHKRPKYNLEFKQDAAKLVIDKGYTHQQAADNLGISLSAIGRWVRAERGPATATSEASLVLNLSGQAELRIPVKPATQSERSDAGILVLL